MKEYEAIFIQGEEEIPCTILLSVGDTMEIEHGGKVIHATITEFRDGVIRIKAD
jgi:hypothetical protein